MAVAAKHVSSSPCSSLFLAHTPHLLASTHQHIALTHVIKQVAARSGMDSKMAELSSYTRAMIELRADVDLKDNIVVAMPKITREGYYTCNIRVEYEWKTPWCACHKFFGHVLEECPNNISNGKLRFVDDDRNPLVLTGIVDSDSEVEVVFDETVNLRISTIDSYLDNDDYDPYDDDIYDNHDISEHLQSICDDLDITAHRPFRDNMAIVIPYVEGSGSYLHTIKVGYEGNPPRCGSCAVFGHDVSKCPKHVIYKAGAKLGTGYWRQNDPSHAANKAVEKSDSDVEDIYDEIAHFMVSGGANDANLYDDEDHDIYDSYDIPVLTKEQLTFCDAMDIRIRGPRR
ncbi:zinc knuckle CX2CX4HX4C containing protein [Tanacetum coccineum]